MEGARNNFFDTRQTEQEGFEPPVPFGTTVFKTVAFNRSATAPDFLNFLASQWLKAFMELLYS